MTPRRSALAGLLLGLLAVVFGPALPASAHAALVATDPVAGSVVPAEPVEVVFVFSEPVRLVPGKTHATGPDGKRADRDTPTVRGDELHVPLRQSSARGTYLVSWRVISADSHPVGGALTFSVGAPSATPSAGTADAARTDPLVAIVLATAHYLGYAGLVLLIGPAVMLYALWPYRLSRRGPIRLVFAGLGLIALGGAAEVLVEAPYTAGVGLFGASSDDLRDAVASLYGASHLVRLAAVAAVAVLLKPILTAPAVAAKTAVAASVGAPAAGGDGTGGTTTAVATADDAPDGEVARRPRAGTADRALLAILAVVGMATWPMSGHAGSSTLPEVTAIADVAHLGAMAVWLGGLVVLVGYLLRRANATELGAILPVWSRWATTAVVVLVVAGTVQALVNIGSFGALFGTTYGRLVLVKVALLAAILLAAYFSRRVARAPSADAGLRALRRSVLVELAIAAVVLSLSSTLVQTTPARTVAAASTLQDSPLYDASLNTPLYTVEVDVNPARVGSNSLHLYASTPAGGPIKVLEWKATASLPAQGIDALPVPLLAITDDHATGEVTLPSAGTWQLKLTLRTSAIDEASVTANVPVRN